MHATTEAQMLLWLQLYYMVIQLAVYYSARYMLNHEKNG